MDWILRNVALGGIEVEFERGANNNQVLMMKTQWCGLDFEECRIRGI